MLLGGGRNLVEPAALEEVCRLVRSLIRDPAARLLVAVETGPDEAFLIGTGDGYVRLALTALEFVSNAVAGRATRMTINGLTVAATSAFGEAIELGEVGLDGGWLAASSEESRKL